MARQAAKANPVPFVRRFGQAVVDLMAWMGSLLIVSSVLRTHNASDVTDAERALVAAVVLIVHLIAARIVGLYQGRFWYGSSRESIRVYVTSAVAALAGVIAALSVSAGSVGVEAVALSLPLAVCLGQIARIIRWMRRRQHRQRPVNRAGRRLIVFGAGDGGELVLRALAKSPTSGFVPVAILDDDPSRQRLEIERVAVMGTRHDLARVKDSTHADSMLIAIPSASSDTIRELTDLGRAGGLDVYVLPGVDELLGAVAADDIRPVSEMDLLGRHPVEIDIEVIASFLTGRRVLVTGAGGSIGSELCRQIQRFAPASLHMLDCDDSGLHAVELSLEGRALLNDERLLLADIRDASSINAIIGRVRPNVVFHAAALKHLTLLERFPDEAWKTNVLGTLNVLEAAIAHGVEHFVNISTDKAADPSSVLGWSKRITERLTAHAAITSGRHYVSVRFGNVLGSRGSVLEIFEAQLRAGGPLTVTHEDVTRYFMTVAEAVRLTMNAAAVGSAGEVLVLDMGTPVRIVDVARRLAASAPRPVGIEFTGLRPGEKLHETLFSAHEASARPAHPKISHVAVPGLDLRSLADLPTGIAVTDDLVRIAEHPEATAATP